MEETRRGRRILKMAGLLSLFISGVLIFIDGYYWSIDSSIAEFFWSGAVQKTWWSTTGHIPLSYWGMICGGLVLAGAIAILVVRNEDIRLVGSIFVVLISIISLVASGGWMIGFILGVVGGFLNALIG